MLNCSEKEYDYLAKEVMDVRSCITRYVGYIIGSNGVLFFIIKIFYEEDKTIEITDEVLINFNTALFPFIGIVIISSLYFIIDYKFASHNRYTGYMQLLSQELRHFQIKEGQDFNIGNTKKLQHGFADKENTEASPTNVIMSWQYIMSRWNSRHFGKHYDEAGFNKLDFRFQLPGYQYNQLDEFTDGSNNASKNVIQWFLEEIIWTPNYKISRKLSLYGKYKKRSWQYPKYIYLISLIQIIIISVFILVADDNETLAEHYWWLIPTVLVWCYYGYNNLKVMRGNRSSDYYCWAFFAYRVQLLNNFNIRPIYFSTIFVRYFKSAILIRFFKKIKTNSELKEKLLKRLEGGFILEFKSLNNRLFYGKASERKVDTKKYDAAVDKLLLKLKNGIKVSKLEKEMIRAVFDFKETQKRENLVK